MVSGGEKGLRARLGRMRHLLCQTGHHVDVQMDEEPGVWLRSFHLLDLEERSEVSADGDSLTIAFAFIHLLHAFIQSGLRMRDAQVIHPEQRNLKG